MVTPGLANTALRPPRGQPCHLLRGVLWGGIWSWLGLVGQCPGCDWGINLAGPPLGP